jgi:hypothetical protein
MGVAFSTARKINKMLPFLTSPATRVGLGTLAGAGISYALSRDYQSPTIVANNTIAGAAIGFGAGMLTTNLIGGTLLKNKWPIFKTALKAGWGTTKMGGRLGIGTATAALKHPFIAGTIGAGAYGMYLLANSGAELSGMDISTMSQVAQQQGLPSTGFEPGMGASNYQDSRHMFMNSTSGLVQGLNNKRHG